MAKVKSCDSCKFWESMGAGEGFCRRHSPTCKGVGWGHDDPVDGVWPWTEGHDWCGEWEEQEKSCDA